MLLSCKNKCKFLSAEGKSFACENIASGYGRGEGSATVLFKRLKDAIRDGNPIRADVRHTRTASIIKVLLGLEDQQIPPSINYENPNTKLDLEQLKHQIPTWVVRWSAMNRPRRVSLNNFGYGGAKAHDIIDEYASVVPSARMAISCHALVAKWRKSLYFKQTSTIFFECQKIVARRMVDHMKDYLKSLDAHLRNYGEEKFLDSLASTLGLRRNIFYWVAAVATSKKSSLVALKSGRGEFQENQRDAAIGIRLHSTGCSVVGYGSPAKWRVSSL